MNDGSKLFKDLTDEEYAHLKFCKRIGVPIEFTFHPWTDTGIRAWTLDDGYDDIPLRQAENQGDDTFRMRIRPTPGS